MAEERSANCSGLCLECCLPTNDLNQTNNSLVDLQRRQYPYLCTCYDFVIEAVLMGGLCLFGFAGNAVSTICLWADKSRTATPFLLISLEVADTLFLATVFPLRVLTSIDTFAVQIPSFDAASPYIGKYVYPLALLAETGTIYVTILVTVNRYISVCHPYRATNLCSVRIARRHVAAVALFSVLINIPRFFEYDIVSSNGRLKLDKNWIMTNKVYKILYSNLIYFFVMFLLPLVSLAILNTRLVAALRRTKTRRARLLKQPTDASFSGVSRSEEDITLMLIVVVMVFVVTQTPAMVTQVLVAYMSEDEIDVCPSAFFFYERLSDLFVVANSSINFIIYCFCSRRFRQILFKLVTGKLKLSPNRSGFRITLLQGRATPQTGAVAIDNDVSRL